jgi:two-component system phosphate regulon sensor histidine kinase PhoR
MTVIKGMSEVLMSSPEDRPMNRRLLETLSRNVDILDRMVVELLDVSEMGAGSFDIRQNRLKLEPILWSVINGVRPDVKQNELDVTVMARNVQSLFVNGDDQRLRWALGHILQNSIRYTEPGGNIVVTAGIDADNPDQIIIDIIDNGVGISDKDLPHIFERFYRGDPRSASSGKLIDPRGLGQGLFVARTVAEAHGGYLTVNSQTGHGSIFSMVLPAANSN